MKTITISDDELKYLREVIYHNRYSGNSYHNLLARKTSYLRDIRWRDIVNESESSLFEKVTNG